MRSDSQGCDTTALTPPGVHAALSKSIRRPQVPCYLDVLTFVYAYVGMAMIAPAILTGTTARCLDRRRAWAGVELALDDARLPIHRWRNSLSGILNESRRLRSSPVHQSW